MTMTTFEITIITLLALIAFALIFRDFIIGKALDEITKNQESQYKKLDFINTQIAGIWRGQDKIETNTAISASIVGKMYNNLCSISDNEKPQCKADIKYKITQMSASNTAAMLENMTDIRKEQEQQMKGGKQ